MKIILEFDENNLGHTDGYLAALWHAAQWNRAPADDPEACRLVERIGREIITRWLKATEPTLWNRQGAHEQALPLIDKNATVRNAIQAAQRLVEHHKSYTVRSDSHGDKQIDLIEQLAKSIDAIT